MNRLLNFFLLNYKPIISSFLLALLLWIVVTTDRDYTTRLVVPLSITRIASGHVLTELPPDDIKLEVTGKGRALIGLNFYDKAIELELPEVDHDMVINLADYQNRFNIARELGIKIVEIIEPKKIALKVDRYAEELKPVELRTQIKPLAGYILMGTKSEHDSVLVRGPQSDVDKISVIYTDSLFKKEVRYPFSEQVDLISPKPEIIRLQPQVITVTFQVEQLVERTLYNIPIQMVGVPAAYSATAMPQYVSVRVKGGESLVSDLTLDEITAVFNFSRQYQQGKINYVPQIETPSQITVMGMSPNKFRLQLQKQDGN